MGCAAGARCRSPQQADVFSLPCSAPALYLYTMALALSEDTQSHYHTQTIFLILPPSPFSLPHTHKQICTHTIYTKKHEQTYIKKIHSHTLSLAPTHTHTHTHTQTHTHT